MDINLINNNSFLLQLSKDFKKVRNPILTGGSIFDLLKCRMVKDWDFLPNNSLLEKLDEVAVRTNVSSTATTYEYLDQTIQVLKKDKLYFPFTIEQSTFNLTNGDFNIDLQSYNTMLLTPTDRLFNTDDYKEVINCLRRLKN